MPKNNTLLWRVSQLEKIVDALDDKVEKVMTNDLPHITERIQKNNALIKEVQVDVSWLKKAFWLVAGASITGAIASIINFITLEHVH